MSTKLPSLSMLHECVCHLSCKSGPSLAMLTHASFLVTLPTAPNDIGRDLEITFCPDNEPDLDKHFHDLQDFLIWLSDPDLANSKYNANAGDKKPMRGSGLSNVLSISSIDMMKNIQPLNNGIWD